MSGPNLNHIISREQNVWDALVAGDPDADRGLLTEDFIGVYPTGFGNRDDHVAQLVAGPTVTHYSVNRPMMITISDDAAMLCYEARYRRPGSDELHRMYVSSLWRLRDGRWVNTFSQDTPVGDATP